MPVPDQIVEVIRDRITTERPRIPLLTAGERVRITEGCFADVEAIFVANDGKDRFVLLMNILHSQQRLKFPLASVRKLTKSESATPLDNHLIFKACPPAR